ncbi:AcrR family transcriptional regulator [Mycolicibacterium sp. BK556]|uniref:TetR/AcrR family transcriptional regulator n=1 Tax=Mycobacteriaceae TaxID=1762 RepID=UPI00161A7A2A|nr:TetR/AcrR family transcriptional regulator [Mycobacterium sp. BK086]MBB3600674.1 AcrR family transcriptional regulator [Mycolicibacterium sp. BK556]MBB3630427.1 AcrR family transcriptional regulator [Mycolicibacterium sp. BK607]
MSVSAKQLSGVQARTRAAILAATAAALAANRTATMPEIAAAAGVGRTTLHRYFADRETLIHEATLDAIRVVNEAADEAATEDGPALDAMRRFITAAVSIGERLVFLFGDPAVLRDIQPPQSPTFELVLNLVTRGQHEGVFDPDLNPTWVRHALYGLILQGCEQTMAGALPRHTIAPLIIRTFERGICPAP